jgi:hypothetical protein
MAWGRRRLVVVAVALVATLAAAGSAQASSHPGCATRLIDDWRDGRIDGTYPVSCYRSALANLPEDLRIYSSAQTDITRALQNRVRLARAPVKVASTAGGGSGVSPYLVAVISVALALGAATVVTLTR